jgi:hypothetical protein
MRQKNMGMDPAGTEPKDDCAGEGQQQLIRPTNRKVAVDPASYSEGLEVQISARRSTVMNRFVVFFSSSSQIPG